MFSLVVNSAHKLEVSKHACRMFTLAFVGGGIGSADDLAVPLLGDDDPARLGGAFGSGAGAYG